MLKKFCLAVATLAAASRGLVTVPSKPTAAFERTETVAAERYVLSLVSHMKVSDKKDEGQAEFFAFDETHKNLLVVNSAMNTLDVYKLTAEGTAEYMRNLTFTGTPNSVAYSPLHDVFAVAVANTNQTDLGNLVFFNAETFAEISDIQTGNPLPDHVSFGPGERCLYSANEGEPKDGIEVYGGVTQVCSSDFKDSGTYVVSHSSLADISEADAADLETYAHNGNGGDIRLYLEPEYITYSEANQAGDYEVYVICQEANVFLVYEGNNQSPTTLSAAPVRMMPLGYKDHSLEGNGLDIADAEDGIEINIKTYKGLYGMYQPDTIKTHVYNGKTYIITANEGDQHELLNEYEEDGKEIEVPTEEDEKISKLLKNVVDKSIVEDPLPEELGNFKVSVTEGLLSDGNYSGFYAYGGRSFGVFDADTGALVYESGDQFEQMMKKYAPDFFNIEDGVIGQEARSRKKGPEPESLASISLDGTELLFVGLERPGLIAVYDITNLMKPEFHSLTAVVNDCASGMSDMVDPEAMYAIPSSKSPTGKPLLIASGSVSSTISIFEIKKAAVSEEDLAICPSNTELEETKAPAPAPAPASSSSSDELTDGAKVGLTFGFFALGIILFLIVLPKYAEKGPENSEEGQANPRYDAEA